MKRVNLASLDEAERRRLSRRSVIPDETVRKEAGRIVEAIGDGGDRALREASLRFGGGLADGNFFLGKVQIGQALEDLDDQIRDALTTAADAIRRAHLRQLPRDDAFETYEGVRIERRWSPLRRVGIYVPGGSAIYPSTLLMGAIPARVAGVGSIVVASPAGVDGNVSQVVMAAAALAQVDEFLVLGGAQAVGALAYGTESIEAVEKIIGPGNAWVTAAKLAVLGECSIDLPAGPSEALIVADHMAAPELVAIDLICQAEHGPDSPVVLVTTSPRLADEVLAAIQVQLDQLPRREILDKSLGNHGLIIDVEDLDSAVAFAQSYAAEHVSIHTVDAEAVADRITSAGSVYVGPWSPESAGDYATGANHVLPTGGLAGAESPLSVEDFGSWRQVQSLDQSGLERLLPTIVTLARAEGLYGHALAAEIRFAIGASR